VFGSEKVGVVTTIVRTAQDEDKVEQVATRKRKAAEKYTESLRLKAVKAAKVDHAEHTATHELALSERELEEQLCAR
jgi:hypothetical protein